MKKTLTCIICCLVLASCEPEPLSIEIPQAETKLVLYTQNLPNQALIVSLSKSFSALVLPNDAGLDSTITDSLNAVFINQFLVDSAIVTVIGPDYNDTLIRAISGFYIAPFFPFTPGNNYRLEAFDPSTGLSIISNTETLPIANFENFTAKRGNGEDSSTITLTYKIEDLPGSNYYLVNIYTASIPQSNFLGFDNDNEGRSFTFTDREYPVNEVSREDNYFYEGDTDSIVATLTNISRDYYDFLLARNRAGNSFLSEPVSFPSNVEGGYGYFNLHFPSALIVKLD